MKLSFFSSFSSILDCEKQINEYIFIFLLSGTLVLDKLQLQYNNGE